MCVCDIKTAIQHTEEIMPLFIYRYVCMYMYTAYVLYVVFIFEIFSLKWP